MNKTDVQALALAAVFEATTQVEKLATTGMKNKESFQNLISSLFVQSPEKPEDVYQAAPEAGLEALIQFLHKGKKKGSFADRYVHGLLYLQKKLTRNATMLETVGSRIAQAKHQLTHFGPDHDNLVANLASIYTDTLSTFRFRIQVMGEMTYLQQPRIANQIRCLLLSGIRAATLWRQMGGSRWQLVLQRRKLLESAERQLYELRKQSVH